ncbi:MAG: hypothetical protein JO168_09355 [Solirubrobacterales bacterium]|nr:hypothetical protein [Solirubrobacterales bacterium]
MAWLLMRESVTVPSDACDRLAEVARSAGVVLVVGVDERERHGGTIYNTVLTFGRDGSLLGRHRKLMPTGGERLVWGMGDGSDLRVLDTPAGRLASLICWENYMPLARFHLYAQGPQIWIAPTLATAVSGWRRCDTSPARASASRSGRPRDPPRLAADRASQHRPASRVGRQDARRLDAHGLLRDRRPLRQGARRSTGK